MRFVIYLVSLTLIGLCSTRAMGQTVEPGQKDGTAKESKYGRVASPTARRSPKRGWKNCSLPIGHGG